MTLAHWARPAGWITLVFALLVVVGAAGDALGGTAALTTLWVAALAPTLISLETWLRARTHRRRVRALWRRGRARAAAVVVRLDELEVGRWSVPDAEGSEPALPLWELVEQQAPRLISEADRLGRVVDAPSRQDVADIRTFEEAAAGLAHQAGAIQRAVAVLAGHAGAASVVDEITAEVLEPASAALSAADDAGLADRPEVRRLRATVQEAFEAAAGWRQDPPGRHTGLWAQAEEAVAGAAQSLEDHLVAEDPDVADTSRADGVAGQFSGGVRPLRTPEVVLARGEVGLGRALPDDVGRRLLRIEDLCRRAAGEGDPGVLGRHATRWEEAALRAGYEGLFAGGRYHAALSAVEDGDGDYPSGERVDPSEDPMAAWPLSLVFSVSLVGVMMLGLLVAPLEWLPVMGVFCLPVVAFAWILKLIGMVFVFLRFGVQRAEWRAGMAEVRAVLSPMLTSEDDRALSAVVLAVHSPAKSSAEAVHRFVEASLTQAWAEWEALRDLPWRATLEKGARARLAALQVDAADLRSRTTDLVARADACLS